MRYSTTTSGGGQGFGLTGPVPTDVWVLLGIVLGTFSLRFFSATAVIPRLLELSSAVWQKGFLWQLVTYPFVGSGTGGFWLVLELIILFLFARTLFYQLGRKRFWRLLVVLSAAAGLVAVVVDLAGQVFAGSSTFPLAFTLMQGQRTLLALLVAAFALINREATILLFFVLPVQAKWFILLELLFAFLGFLSTHDLPGFLGICAGIGTAFVLLSPGQSGRLRELWLRTQERWFRFRLGQMKKKRGFRVVRGEKKDDWLH